MLTWLLPYYLVGVCLTGEGGLEPKTFGPFPSEAYAAAVEKILWGVYYCETRIERRPRWTEAVTLTLPPELEP